MSDPTSTLPATDKIKLFERSSPVIKKKITRGFKADLKKGKNSIFALPSAVFFRGMYSASH